MTSWRDMYTVHPAADLFPMMSRDELIALGNDIKVNGLKVPIVFIVGEDGNDLVLDGRNRLDAIEAVGLSSTSFKLDPVVLPRDADAYEYVISANIYRRHLTAEQKRELIAKVLKAKPDASNRQIAAQVKADDKTVGKVRQELEATAEIPQLEKRTGKDGKARTTGRKKPGINVATEMEANRENIDRALAMPGNPSDRRLATLAGVDVKTIKAARDAAARDARLKAAVAAHNKALALCRATDSEAIKYALSSFFELAEFEQARFLEIVKEEISNREEAA